MRKKHDPIAIRTSLRSRASLVAAGWTDKQIRAAVRTRDIRRVHHGWYILQSLWDGLFWEQQHLAHVMAVVDDARAPGPIAAGESAAVVYGLPLYHHRPARVHVICNADERVASTADVMRHYGPLEDFEIAEVNGIRCTSLARTVVDVARTCDLETAVACADAALRQVAVNDDDPFDYCEDAAEDLRREMRAVIDRMPRSRGIRVARWVVEFADGRAQSIGESVTRLRFVQLGFRVPRVQVRIDGPNGAFYVVDLDAEYWWVEFDGSSKYLDPQLRSGLSAGEVVVAEKKREDWIRAVSGRMVVRLGDEHIVTLDACAQRLAEYGIVPPRHRPSPDPGPPR